MAETRGIRAEGPKGRTGPTTNRSSRQQGPQDPRDPPQAFLQGVSCIWRKRGARVAVTWRGAKQTLGLVWAIDLRVQSTLCCIRTVHAAASTPKDEGHDHSNGRSQ